MSATYRKPSREKDKRGNVYDRADRKVWLLRTFGDGETCPCTHCGCALDTHTLEADRIVPGGTYARYNVQPSCSDCNRTRGDDPNWVHPSKAAVL